MTFLISKNGIRTGTPSNAFEKIRRAKNKRVDIVMFGDSNQHYEDKGFDYAINNFLHDKFGTYASPVFCNEVYPYQNYDSFLGLLDAPSTIESNHADYFINDGNGTFLSTTSVRQGIRAYKAGRFDLTSEMLRYWYGWAGFNSGTGNFTPKFRNDTAGSTITLFDVVATNTGDFDRKVGYFDVDGSGRDYDFGFYATNGTLNQPGTLLFHRVENRELSSGISCHSLYGVSGASLYDAATQMNTWTIGQLTGYFSEIRRLQLAKGQVPDVVVYINFGINDKSETARSIGYYREISSTTEGYVDNLLNIVGRIEDVWAYNGWDQSELSFLVVPSHVIASPNNSQLTGYRNAVKDIQTRRQNFSCVDLSEKMSYEYANANGWYSATTNHLSETGYAAVADLILSAV